MSRTRSLVSCALVGAALVLVGTLLPWLRSGRRWRNSFSLARVLGHVAGSRSSLWTSLLRCWPLIWPLTIAVVLAIGLGRPALARAGAAVLVVTLTGIGLAASARSVDLGYGYWTVVGGTLLLVASSLLTVRRDVG